MSYILANAYSVKVLGIVTFITTFVIFASKLALLGFDISIIKLVAGDLATKGKLVAGKTFNKVIRIVGTSVLSVVLLHLLFSEPI